MRSRSIDTRRTYERSCAGFWNVTRPFPAFAVAYTPNRVNPTAALEANPASRRSSRIASAHSSSEGYNRPSPEASSQNTPASLDDGSTRGLNRQNRCSSSAVTSSTIARDTTPPRSSRDSANPAA